MPTQPSAELLPCPNPWCDRSEPCVRQISDRIKPVSWAQVYCAQCDTVGPRENSAAAAVAAWNTRCDVKGGIEGEPGWTDAASPAPEGQPVVALYRAFNRPDGRWMRHVVWWVEGGWRIYPFTANRGHVDRWRPLVGC